MLPDNYYQDGADFYHEETGHVWSAPFPVRDGDMNAAEQARLLFLEMLGD